MGSRKMRNGGSLYGYDLLDQRSTIFLFKAERFMLDEGYAGATKFGGVCNDALQQIVALVRT